MSIKIQSVTKSQFKLVPHGHAEEKSLRRLSDNELLLSLKNCVAKEKEILVEVLNHLKEFDSRRLYLELGYSSLWAYCTIELKYSEAAAQRRIETMRALRETPALEEKILSGALTITNIAKVQSAVRRAKSGNGAQHQSTTTSSEIKLSDHDTKLELFTKLENKSGREADDLLAKTFPEMIIHQQKIRQMSAEHFAVQLTVNKQLFAKLEQVKSLYSHQYANQSLAETIEFLADLAIKNKLTQRFGRVAAKEHEVREACNTSTQKQVQPPLRRSEPSPCSITKTLKTTSRSLTNSLRLQVWQKAGAACEYTNPKSGRRCDSRHKLEIEHDTPLALGGTHDLKNLKLYCQAHNQLAARHATLR